ncbi:hypothetical protein F8M41_017528 [Gigaspora margarita]|uniref:Uncharacterized protein n=1 Tax=Gigaspora margarita TaxID=4874 RepID=A0A8H4EM03_GIGMA|nr:hypothetical protein F8M41_017528 [Gigaspora margarita]
MLSELELSFGESTFHALKQQIIVLEAENAKITSENMKLKQIIEENTRREDKNIELKAKVAKLECDIEELKQQTQIINNAQNTPSTVDISHSLASSPLLTFPSPIGNRPNRSNQNQ